MELVKKTPCNDCPWRRKSLQGWLGESGPRGFVRAVLTDNEMPCHITVDYTAEDWQEQGNLCAGALLFLNNQLKRPRDPDLAAACDEVADKDPKVFRTAAEFIEHHGGDNHFQARLREKYGDDFDPNMPFDIIIGIPMEEPAS